MHLHLSAPDDLGVPFVGILGDPLLAAVVHIDQAEVLLVAVTPLEIVRQGPVEVATDIGAVFDGLAEVLQVSRQEIDPVQEIITLSPSRTTIFASR